MELRWTDALAVGVPAIDAQHRELVSRVGRVVSAVDTSPEEVGALLDFLGEYALSHFAAEERLTTLHGYPAAAAAKHREAHATFVRAFAGLRYDVEMAGVNRDTTERIERWIVTWLLEHIRGMDHALAVWIQSRQAQSPPAIGTWLLPRAEAIEVLAVSPRGSLDRAGLEAGDFIVAVGGRTVREQGVTVAFELLRQPAAGEVEVEFHRGADTARVERRVVRRKAPAGG